MKRNTLIGMAILSLGLQFTACDDDDNDGKAVNLTIKEAVTTGVGDLMAINVNEGQTLQLNAFVMPESAREQPVSFRLAGTPSGAIEISPDGLITPLLTTPAEGDIPNPLGTDTIIATVDDGSGVFVRYPVRVLSSVALVTSITIQTAGQSPKIKKGETFALAGYLTIKPATATDATVSYSSEDKSIATVDPSGQITAVGEVGQTTYITVTANDRGKQKAVCFVTIV